MPPRIMVSICTRNRYDYSLPMTLTSVLNQTLVPTHVQIFDDSPADQFKDITKIEAYQYIFQAMAAKGISTYIEYGPKKGQHHLDERANTLGYDYVLRLDDDMVAEPDVLEKLVAQMAPNIGAVGCSILTPPQWESAIKSSSINHLDAQNKQWFPIDRVEEVDHLHGAYLYRAGVCHWDLRYSNKAFRAETAFSYSFKLKGYKVLITPGTIWHFKSSGGGNRSDDQAIKDQEHDQLVFDKWLSFTKRKKKIYVLKDGLGDHYAFRSAIEPEPGSIIACCYPEVFKDREHDCEIISIAMAEELVDVKDFDIYRWADDTGIKLHCTELYKALYAHIYGSARWK